MIISDEHRYLFIQNPRTASSQTGRELVRNYGGRRVLKKHSKYAEFREAASERQLAYFVFIGVRNPLDSLLTLYHRGRGRGKVDSRMTYCEWLESLRARRIERALPRDLEHVDFTIRYERLDDDFARALRHLGLEPVRTLPRSQPTKGKPYSMDAYDTPEVRAVAMTRLGEVMERQGYRFPESWQ